MAHSHAHPHPPEIGAGDADKSRRLFLAALLTAGIFVIEVIGGFLSGSLALLSDAGHVFADVGSLALSYVALRLACRLPTDTRTFGLHRAEIFAAMINGISLVVIALLIWHEAWLRFRQPPEIKTGLMMVIAIVGLAVNVVVLTRLSGHHHDLNVRSAYLHVLGDMLASVGVVVAAVVMATTGWYLVDPIMSAALGLLIIWGAWRVLDEAMHILLLGVPRALNLRDIAAAMNDIPGVNDVHAMRLWAPCSNLFILSAHVVACPETDEERVKIIADLRSMLETRFNIAEVTLEMESTSCPVPSLVSPLVHPEAPDHDHDHDHEGHDH